MMRRNIFVLGISMMCLMLCSCSHIIEGDTHNRFYINLNNDCSEDIAGFEIDLYSGETIVSSAGGVSADGSVIKRGETMAYEFRRSDIATDVSLSSLSFRVQVLLMNGNKIPCKNIMKFSPRFSEVYEYNVYGSTIFTVRECATG